MKYFRLLTDNSQWFAGESIFSERLVKRMLRELPAAEAKAQKFEEVSEEFVNKNQYFMVYDSDFSCNSGERNVFHDINGNEYHN